MAEAVRVPQTADRRQGAGRHFSEYGRGGRVDNLSLFTFNEVRSAYREWQGVDREILAKSADQVLKEERRSFEEREYDVFLSHSSLDAKDVLGLCRVLRREFGLTVYLDLDDEQLDSDEVTPDTARVLRQRMKYSRVLFYASSVNASASKWMPWELGYFDGLKGAVAVVPVGDDPSESYEGQEYLGLYPYIDRAPNNKTGAETLWVNGLSTTRGYMDFNKWLSTIEAER